MPVFPLDAGTAKKIQNFVSFSELDHPMAVINLMDNKKTKSWIQMCN